MAWPTVTVTPGLPPPEVTKLLVLRGSTFFLGPAGGTSGLRINLYILTADSTFQPWSAKREDKVGQYRETNDIIRDLCRKISTFVDSLKSCRSSCLESQIINMKLKRNQQKVPPPKLPASDQLTCGNFQH